MDATGSEGQRFTLADRLARPVPLTPPEVASVGAQLAGVLDAWHRAGRSHLALVPAVVAVHRDPGGRLSARVPDAPAPTTPDPRFLPPEQLAGRPVGPAADVYSLGVVLLTCLVGTTPDPLVVPPDLGTAWRYLLAGMLAASASDRPTAEHVARTLAGVPGAYVPGTATPAVTPAVAPAVGGWPRSKLLPRGRRAAVRDVDVPRDHRLGRLLPHVPGRRRPPEPDVRH